MNSPITGLRTAAIVFALMALAQLLRLLINPAITVAGHAMPVWPSLIALAFLGGMSRWMFKLSCAPGK